MAKFTVSKLGDNTYRLWAQVNTLGGGDITLFNHCTSKQEVAAEGKRICEMFAAYRRENRLAARGLRLPTMGEE